ncbi:MAG: universal stress protein [Archaeoglobus sp.]|uniref:universal stress protein n=1 Tax=Archaeoglobus sp. TaxID=1872626 RepID=UPI001D6074BA|nr:universal stress protein [Archaeoglobus sp.]MBO8180936.1 universal stress protein [Archaeoglobus sp.]
MPIVVAIDKKSDRAERTLKFAAEEAELRGMPVYVVHSLPGGSKTTDEDVFEAEKALSWAVSILKKEGVKGEKHLLVRGKEPAQDIVDFADEIDAKMVVIGVRKRSPTGKLLFGSVARDVILHANKPVACIK